MIVAAYCETNNRLRFFRRFAPALSRQGGTLIVLSNKYSVVRAARRGGMQAALIRGEAGFEPVILAGMDLYEVRKGVLAATAARQGLARVESFLEKFCRTTAPDCFLIWNGSTLVARAIGSYAKALGIDTLFFEIGNFPGKLFVDPDGVNIRSWFASHCRELDRTSLDLGAFERWCHSYLEGKRRSHLVQQARTSTGFNWAYPLDLAGYLFFAAPYSESLAFGAKTANFVRSKMVNYVCDQFDPASSPPFLFFPLQVSSDSQLLWNSEVDNREALAAASKLADTLGLLLVVKPHPAEIDRVSVARLLMHSDRTGYKFVEANTFQLLSHCHSVITINSTVGMEAMLCGKAVTTLGRAMYSQFSLADLAFYLQEYLLDIDFFADEPLSEAEFEAVMSYRNPTLKFVPPPVAEGL